MSKRKYIVLGVILLLSGIVVYFSFFRKTPNVIISVSPSTASFVLDKTHRVAASFYVAPNEQHSVAVSFAGFSTVTKTFSMQPGKTTKFVILLMPNSPEGTQWLLDHPAEQSKRQVLGGADFTQSTQKRIADMPILKQLPYYEEFFEISYSQSLKNPNDNTAVEIDVTYYSVDGKQQAIQWIRDQGYDPNTLNIVYINQITSDPSQ